MPLQFGAAAAVNSRQPQVCRVTVSPRRQPSKVPPAAGAQAAVQTATLMSDKRIQVAISSVVSLRTYPFRGPGPQSTTHVALNPAQAPNAVK
jgi:hypothetical protein